MLNAFVYFEYICRYEYAAHEVYEKDQFIVLEGTVDNHLYLLQYGKVTAYTAQTDGSKKDWKVKRLRTMGSGAVINDDMLFRNTVVGHSVVRSKLKSVDLSVLIQPSP